MKANEILEIASKQWASTKDIQSLAEVGEHTARKIKKEIKKIVESRNWKLPNDEKVPMKDVIDYLHIDIKYLSRIKKEGK